MEMLKLEGTVDLIIPRGGESLIRGSYREFPDSCAETL